jgi:glycosyltransferase involved in cell wall biosynthesis
VEFPPVSFVVQTWNREEMLHKCIDSLINQVYAGEIHVEVVDDKSTDGTKGLVDHWTQISKMHPNGRSVSYREGPGYSNFRPGGIFKSFFDHCLTSDAFYVSYQFSDDYSPYDRVVKSVAGMMKYDKMWAFANRTHFVNEHCNLNREVRHHFDRQAQMYPAIGPSLPVYSMLFNREAFIDIGGCEEPERAGLAAEAWIVAHAGLMGDPYVADFPMHFREHPTNLGATGRKGQDLYNRATAVTGMHEEDHWVLWREIEPVYNERVAKARNLHV